MKGLLKFGLVVMVVVLIGMAVDFYWHTERGLRARQVAQQAAEERNLNLLSLPTLRIDDPTHDQEIYVVVKVIPDDVIGVDRVIAKNAEGRLFARIAKPGCKFDVGEHVNMVGYTYWWVPFTRTEETFFVPASNVKPAVGR
jgi:hypothetical protein